MNTGTYPSVHLVAIFLIAVLGFAVYANSLDGEFILDDISLVRDNVYIRNFSRAPKIITENIAAGAGRKSAFYRPLQIFTYMADYAIWKLNVKGYHLTNILLHILAALCVYYLANLLSEDRFLALLAGALFVVNPVHTEAVTYISGRSDSLALIFMLFSFIFYLKCFSGKNIKIYILMVLSYALALLSRETSLILPVLLLVYHYTYKKKIRVREFLSVAGIALIYILLRLTALKSLSLHADLPVPTGLFQRIPGFFVAVANYIRLLILPFNLHIEYGNILFGLSYPGAIVGILLSSLLLIYAFMKRKDNGLISFSIFWFFAALLPVSNLYPVNAYMAEHWLYLPSIGFFLILGKTLSYLYKRRGFKVFALFFAAGLLFFYSYLTVKQNNYWREPVVFYKRTLKYAPPSSRMLNNLGTIYCNSGRNEEAIPQFKKAIKINPNYADAYNNLGIAYNNTGRTEDAIAAFEKSAELDPGYADTYYNLGIAYGKLGRLKEAIAAFEKSIEIYPDFTAAYNNIGVAYYKLGRTEKAIESFKKVLEIDPDYRDARHNLSVIQ